MGQAHPNRFMYARPANSGPGRTFMMGLPYILGDKDPMDPVNGWEKTWAYLRELNAYIEYYPSGTTATMKEFGEGSRDIIISTTGWDINPRALGIVPKSAQIGTLKGFHWVSDAFFMVVPKGVADEKLAVLFDLMAFLLKPEQQAFSYDEGYLYPGPAVKNVPLSMAPRRAKTSSRSSVGQYADLISGRSIELPLTPKKWSSRSAAGMRRSAPRKASEACRPVVGDERLYVAHRQGGDRYATVTDAVVTFDGWIIHPFGTRFQGHENEG